MKAKTLIACAAAAVALPLSQAWATMPTGPQGTGWYGAANGALPVPQEPQPYANQPYANQTDPRLRNEARADWRNSQRAEAREQQMQYPWYRQESRTPVLQGHSADTNPPVPAP